MKTIIIPLEDEDIEKLEKLKERLGLTWKGMLMLSLKKEVQ